MMKNIKQLILSVAILLSSYGMFAQQQTITGTVYTATDNVPLPGVSVTIKNTSKGTTTDFDGVFFIQASSSDVLEFSYIGFEAQEVALGGTNNLTITLQEAVSALEEIVVVGYGTQRKKEVTGAVSVLSSENIEKTNPTRIENALQGQISGVNIVSNSGSPGGKSSIRIRGISTNGDNKPFILVDGNVIEELDAINPNDIESINVLKDATAGIYGVRAANGVIIITTKSGRKNTPLSFAIDTYSGFQTTSKKLDLLKPRDFALYVNDATGKSKFLVFPETGTDWQDEVFNTAAISNVNISASGGTKKSTYSFGASYLDQDGIVGLNKSNFSRLTARFNFKYDPLDNLKIKTTGLYTHSDKNNLPEGGIGAVLYNAVNINPNLAVYDQDGDFSLVEEIAQIEIINPLAQVANTYNTTTVDKFSATLGVDYSFWDNFTASSSIQLNHATVLYDIFRPIINYGPSKGENKAVNEVVDEKDIYDDYTWDNYIKYTDTFNDDHHLTVLLGTSAFRTQGKYYGITGFQLKDGSNDVADASIENTEGIQTPRHKDQQKALGQDFFDVRLMSYFTRVQYNYKQKYLFSGVLRRDGSTAFPTGNKFGYFPSASIGWNVSEESFFQDTFPWVNSFKLRASYGILGNDRIGSFRYITRLDGEATYVRNDEVEETDLLNGTALGRPGNQNIKWEEQKSTNFGLDLKVLDNRLNLSVERFHRETDGLLIAPRPSGVLGSAAQGSGNPYVNAGAVENEGWEFSLAYNDSFSEDFDFNANFNFSTLDNKVLYVESEQGYEEGGSFRVGQGLQTSRMEAGFPIGYFYGYKTDGIYQNQAEIDALDASAPADAPDGVYHKGAGQGDLKFVDVNGDGYIDENDKTNIGDPIPDLTMGLSLGFTYKNFDFSSSAFGSFGNDMVRDYERQDTYANRGDYLLDRWLGDGTSNTVPKATTGASINTDNFSDFFVEDASYIRIQNIQLGYTFGEKFLTTTGIDKLRVYVSANNVYTFTDYKGYDPSASSDAPIGAGVDKGFYPVATSYLLGLNLKF